MLSAQLSQGRGEARCGGGRTFSACQGPWNQSASAVTAVTAVLLGSNIVRIRGLRIHQSRVGADRHGTRCGTCFSVLRSGPGSSRLHDAA
jgi:hypothetical protein